MRAVAIVCAHDPAPVAPAGYRCRRCRAPFRDAVEAGLLLLPGHERGLSSAALLLAEHTAQAEERVTFQVLRLTVHRGDEALQVAAAAGAPRVLAFPPARRW